MSTAIVELKAPTKGVSLSRDAWRHLRRNRLAMVSLGTLIVIGLLAFFTPLLPLQPPDRDLTKLQYEPPRWSPLFDESFKFDWDAAEQTPDKLRQVRQELTAARQQWQDALDKSNESD